MYYHRKLESEIFRGLENNPVVAILGPRQFGKSTLAKYIASQTNKEVTYLDLERPMVLNVLKPFISSQISRSP